MKKGMVVFSSLNTFLSPGAGSTTDDKKEMNERRHASQFMGQNSPCLTVSLYSGKNVSLLCKQALVAKSVLLSNQKTKKRHN